MIKRVERMTERERVEALLRREKPDRVPLWPFAIQGFAVINAGLTIADAYNNPGKSLEAQRLTSEQYGWVCVPSINYAAYGGWEFGGTIKWPSGQYAQAPTIERYPVVTEDDVWKLHKPEVARAGIVPLIIDFHRLSARERLPAEPFNVRISGVGSAFTMAANICGPEKLCRWLIKKPDIAHRLLSLASEHILDCVHYMNGIFGIDGVLPAGGEPTAANQMISPKHFAEFVMPYDKAITEKVLGMGYQHIYIHICGEHNANLPYWAQIPFGNPGIISIGHEIAIETAARYFPRDIILGNIDPSLIQTGTPREVYEATRICIEKGKQCPGGFIFSPGCQLPPKAAALNVWMMTKAVNDFGWYK